MVTFCGDFFFCIIRTYGAEGTALRVNIGIGVGGVESKVHCGFVVRSHIFKRNRRKIPRFFSCLKSQLPAPADHFDLCFAHTTGEDQQLWF